MGSEDNYIIINKANCFDSNDLVIASIENDPFANMKNQLAEYEESLDNMYCEFLEENGYKIDKPYNIEQLKEIKEDLEKQDKCIDYLEYTEFAHNCTQAYHYVIPFFNSISNPLTEETRNEIIEKWKEKNGKDK